MSDCFNSDKVKPADRTGLYMCYHRTCALAAAGYSPSCGRERGHQNPSCGREGTHYCKPVASDLGHPPVKSLESSPSPQAVYWRQKSIACPTDTQFSSQGVSLVPAGSPSNTQDLVPVLPPEMHRESLSTPEPPPAQLCPGCSHCPACAALLWASPAHTAQLEKKSSTSPTPCAIQVQQNKGLSCCKHLQTHGSILQEQ